MQKYDFSIRTRDGQLIKRLMIAARDREEAERKLKQMYRNCEIVRYGSHQQEMTKPGHKNYTEDMTPLLAKEESMSA